MRLGQTSAVQFASKILVSAVGFLATLYFARVVGADVLGTYFLLLSAMAGLSILIEAGLSESIAKRMSEGTDPGGFFLVGSVVVLIVFIAISIVLFGFADQVRDYIQSPSAVVFLIALVGGSTAMTLVNAGLTGSHNVHMTGVLTSLQSVLRAGVQVLGVSLGLSLLGLVAGWVVAALVAALIGVLYLSQSIHLSDVPSKADLRRRISEMYGYAKYSWLGSIKAKTNNYADILVLGLFVPNGLIGVYAVSWNIASFLTIFGAAIQETLFPAISQVSSEGDHEEASQLVHHSLRFTGLFVIPGLFGGALLGSRILRLYGPDFEIGTAVLYLLIIAVLLFDYQKQLTSALNGMDRPELAFRANASFIVSNIVLNLALVAVFGWVGAAVATAVSSGIGLLYSYRLTNRLIDIEVPLREIGNQLLASVAMAAVVYGLLRIENTYGLVNSNFVVVGILVAVGGGTYLATIVLTSEEIRAAVLRNLV